MPFVLSDKFATKLSNIRTDYEKRSGLDLDKTPQPYAISCFFGAKDIKSRNKQISFIEQWITVLGKDLSLDNHFDSQEALQNHLTALRLLTTVCLYVKSQIDLTYKMRSGASAVLKQLVDEAMGVSSVNNIDEETRACCLLAAKRYLAGENRFEAINANLKLPFTEKQWHDFSKFITEQCNLLDKKYLNNYPITKMMVPLVARPLELAGYTTGFVMGDMVGKSTKLLPTRYAMTAAIGSGLYLVMGPTASFGAILLAPTYAGRILDTFCGVSLAWVMGAAMNIVGQGIGFGIGMSLDVSWKLLYDACALLMNLYRSPPHTKLTGISLIDGLFFIDGIDFQLIDLDNLPKKLSDNYTECPIEVKVDNEELIVTVNGQQAKFPWKEKQAYMDELKKLLAAKTKAEPELVSLLTP